MATYVSNERLKELQGNLSDSDYARVGEVIEKQDIYSKSARRSWLAKKYLPKLIIYNAIIFIGLLLCLGYTAYYFFNKPTPLFLYEGEDGKISCARAYVKKNNNLVIDFTDKQKEVCYSLKKYEK